MGLFGAIVRTAVNVATLPIAAATDVALVLVDAAEGNDPGHRTKAKLEQIKDEANDDR